MSHENAWLKAFGDIPVECFSGLLSHLIRVFDHPNGFYRSFPESIERCAEHFQLDVGELRAITHERLHPSESILEHYNLELIIMEDVCSCLLYTSDAADE